MSRIPSLDGLRAISISLVIFGHLANQLAARTTHPRLMAVFGNAGFGVEVFFVISGYLITSILLREFDRSGTIKLRTFYFRRTMRIFPAFYAYLVGATLFCWFALSRPHTSDVVAASLYSLDYLASHRFWAFEHIWSLSVEEQFYLLWPTILLGLLAWRGRRAARWFAFVLLVCTPVLRVASAHLGSHNLYFMLHTRADALMAGCLLALCSGTVLFERSVAALSRFAWLAAAFALVASSLLELRFGGAYIYTIGMTLECVCITLCIIVVTRDDNSAVAKMLNWTPIAWVGTLSYSIYLWQELFLHPADTSVAGRLPLSLLLVLICAALSYYWVEKPFLSLRERLESRPTVASESFAASSSSGA